ncbi:MAG: DNA gyrase inhibitor YacG [Candidatus Binatia bacterium]
MPLPVKCPTCRDETTWENNPHRPFCSKRCQTIDLGAWIEERYKIPGDDFELLQQDDDDDDDDDAR